MTNTEFKNEIIFDVNKINAEEYFIEKFKKEGYECYKSKKVFHNNDIITNSPLRVFLNNEKSHTGIPDLLVYNSDSFFFVEVKSNKDALRKSQIKWIHEHTDIKVIVYYLEQKEDTKKVVNTKVVSDKKIEVVNNYVINNNVINKNNIKLHLIKRLILEMPVRLFIILFAFILYILDYFLLHHNFDKYNTLYQPRFFLLLLFILLTIVTIINYYRINKPYHIYFM